MKFTITSITEEGVKAKEDNMALHPADINPTSRAHYDKLESAWEEAEANRVEYNVSDSEVVASVGFKGVWLYRECKKGIFFTPVYTGDRIEGDIINNEIVNVRIL